MDKVARNKTQTKFNNNIINVIVSTVAYSMGIDQIVQCVIIFGSPHSIDDFYQQVGRCGRNNESAEAILFFQYKNIAIATSMIKKNNTEGEITDNKINGLKKMANFFYTKTCRRRVILEHFNQIPKFFWCNYCDNCCERETINLTDKFIDILFKNKPINKILSDNELLIVIDNNLMGRRGNTDYEILGSLKNWKRIIETNKYLERNIPKKYNIMCAI